MKKRDSMSMAVAAVIAALLLGLCTPALADEDSWSTGGPYGGTVMAIAVHPSDTLRMYIGTLSNGIFQTFDGGAGWSIIEDDTLRSGCAMRVIQIHPFAPDTIYAGASEGLFKSTDAGESWFRLPLPNPENEYRTLEIHPDNPSMLFTGDAFWPYKSTDGGETWYRCIGGIPTIVSVEEFKIDPINTNVVYFTGGREYKSTDYGENWHNIRPDSHDTGTTGVSIAIDPVNSEIVYLGRYDIYSIGTCLYKSVNGGDDWRDITPPGLVRASGVLVYDVVVSPFDHNMVFIVTMADGIFRSPDGGETWEEIYEGLVVRDAATIVIDPRTGYIYLGLFYDGIYRSTNNGDSWQKISHNVTEGYCTDIAANWRDPDTLYTATFAGLFISTDGAESWERIILDIPYYESIPVQVEVDPYDPSYIYLPLERRLRFGGGGAFYRSTDGGSTWESFTAGLPSNTGFLNMAVADYNGSGWRRLFMGTRAGLYYSDNLGESWSLCQGGLPDILFSALSVSPVNPEIVFAGVFQSNDVYKSADGGGSWEPLNMPRGWVSQIVCDPVDRDIVYVCKDNEAGIFKSTDGGQTWDNIDNNLPRGEYPFAFSASGIAVNPLNHDNLFVFSSTKGVFQSHDGGQTWEDFNEGLRIRGINARILIDPTDTSRVFMSLWANSVWSITRTQTGIDDKEDILPVTFSAFSYPNPFNPSTTIEYSLPGAASVTVEVYDLLGRRVQTLVARNQRAGTHRVVWDAKDRASGLYYYLINAGQYSTTGIMTLLK